MAKLSFCINIFVVLALAGSAMGATVELQEDFTSAQNGTLPATLTADYDPGTDISVQPLSAMVPAIPADHSGGDGYALRVGDIGSGGGAYDFVEPSGYVTMNLANSRVSAWVYVEFDTNTSGERDYILYSRRDPALGKVQDGISAIDRDMYMFMISEGSSWSGLPSNPIDYKPYILVKKSDGSHSYVGTQTAPDVAAGWHFMELICSGTTITGKVDGVVVVTGTDTTYASGYSGVGYYDDNASDTTNNPFAATYDNLKIESFTAGVEDWSIYN